MIEADGDTDEVRKARRAAVEMTRDAAAKGNPIAGMLAGMEQLAEPFYLGIDDDEDDSDVTVFP